MKVFFCIGGFPLAPNIIYYYLLLGDTNNLLRSLVKIFLCTLWESGFSKKVLQ